MRPEAAQSQFVPGAREWATLEALESRLLLAGVTPSAWPMLHGDIWNTGRAPYSVPVSRQNSSFFDIFLWQTQTPNSPTDGSVGSTSMTFYDGAGPNGADIVVGGYHWPKGIQGMDRHTGQVFWSGNPSGGEAIGSNAPAFSNDGSVVYVTNDATESGQYPNGTPLMAFKTTDGPSNYWHNGADPQANLIGAFSPKIAPDGRIFLHAWNDRPYASTDYGTAISTSWAAASQLSECFGNPALYQGSDGLHVIAAGRSGLVKAFDGGSGTELWSVNMGQFTDADPTVDPANGNIYVPVGSDSISIVGLNKDGNALWASPAEPVFQWINGQNNPQRAESGGALSFDGATFYFQTESYQGDGELYAINTADGSVEWTFATHSQGNDSIVSSPIVTRDGIVIVGNNVGRTYYAIRDEGTKGTLIDSLAVDSAGIANASPTLSSDGVLYLPLRIVQTTGGGGQSPTYQVENLFTAIDLSANASAKLYPPAHQRAVAGNHQVSLLWTPLIDPTGQFDHYAIYRATLPFTSVAGMMPIATVADIAAGGYVDTAAANGTSYYYAVTAVSAGGGEITSAPSVGPRTPRDETDLQVVSIARSPEYPRYLPIYTGYQMTEPSGFGPYTFTAATGLNGGQTFDTQRFPNIGDPVTYTATVRNRGTNTFTGALAGHWNVDGAVVVSASQPVSLQPGQTTTFTYVIPWDNQPHELDFTIDVTDARSQNNTLSSNTLAVPFLTYVDSSFIETFREVWSTRHPGAKTDDMIDWLNMNMQRFNELFANAGSPERVHYGVLQVLDDTMPDPTTDTTPYAIFPFRYHAGTDGDPRLSGYYNSNDDIDYGLLHEMGHQLGLIDIYQLDVPPEANQVSGMGYSGPDDLMRNVAPFLSENSADAMTHWLHEARGYFGQYLYNLPATMQLRIDGFDGKPLSGATVKVYQYVDRPGLGKVITNQIKFQGTTDANGIYTLPNVPIDPSIIPKIGTGDELHPNPFGYVACVGTNGVFLFRIEYAGGVDYAWLDITQANNAYWEGQTATATFDRQVALGGPVQTRPPIDMAENNASDWSTWAQGGTATIADDSAQKVAGQASLRFVTDGGFDNYLRYPRTYTAHWDLTQAHFLNLSLRTDNPNGAFQNGSPWIRLSDANGNYFEYQYFLGGGPYDLLNETMGQWKSYQVPLDAAPDMQNGWRRTAHGTPDLSNIQYLEIHADTWGYGFTLWVDGLGFDLPAPSGNVTLNGSDGNDTWFLRTDGTGTNLEIFENVPITGSPNYRIPLSSISSLTINGGGGDDSLTVLSPLPLTPVFNGGAGNNLLDIRAGTYQYASDLSASSDHLSLLVSNATVQFASSQHLASLAIAPGGNVELAHGGPRVIVTDGLQIAGDGTLDLSDNDLIVRTADPASRQTVLDAITSLIEHARDKNVSGELWQGSGITTSAASTDGTGLTGLAAIANIKYDPSGAPSVLYPTLWGENNLDMNSILVKYTWNGDTNIDGVVNFDDYYRINTGFLGNGGKGGYGWGDLNFDGIINFDDYFLINSAFLGQSSSAPSAPMAVVLKPAARLFSTKRLRPARQ